VREGKFPLPIYPTDGSPAHWRLSTVENFLARRAASRRKRPTPRGRLKQQAKQIARVKLTKHDDE